MFNGKDGHTVFLSLSVTEDHLQSFATSAHTLKLWARNAQLIYISDNSKRKTTYLNPKYLIKRQQKFLTINTDILAGMTNFYFAVLLIIQTFILLPVS